MEPGCLCQKMFWVAPSPDLTGTPKETSMAQPRTLHQASIVEGRCRVERGQDVRLNMKESVTCSAPIQPRAYPATEALVSRRSSADVPASDRLHAAEFLFLQ